MELRCDDSLLAPVISVGPIVAGAPVSLVASVTALPGGHIVDCLVVACPSEDLVVAKSASVPCTYSGRAKD